MAQSNLRQSTPLLVIGGLIALIASSSVLGHTQRRPARTSLPYPLTVEHLEILSHLSIEYIDNGQGGLLKTIRVSGVNLQIVNGGGVTSVVDGLGNLIVGYNEPGAFGFPDSRTGSHNLVVGTKNSYVDAGGVVFGENNSIEGAYSTVVGGFRNRATGDGSAVSSGSENTASGRWAGASGGQRNNAIQEGAWTGGGRYNTASGQFSCVVGGGSSSALGSHSSVFGGGNVGAPGNYAVGNYSTALGGRENHARGEASTASGGILNEAIGAQSTVSGGAQRTAPGADDWVAGSLFEDN